MQVFRHSRAISKLIDTTTETNGSLKALNFNILIFFILQRNNLFTFFIIKK